MTSPLDALENLRAGNRRYLSRQLERCVPMTQEEREALLKGQDPIAVVIGCSDSRVPVEMVFDQGAGDLFVIRVAGNVVGTAEVGSIEFAVQRLCTRLIVVMGHTHCGAVQATLDLARRPSPDVPENLRKIVERIERGVAHLLESEVGDDPEALARRMVRENIRSVANELRLESAILGELIESDDLLVIGAEYSLETGEVEFFDGLPEEMRR